MVLFVVSFRNIICDFFYDFLCISLIHWVNAKIHARTQILPLLFSNFSESADFQIQPSPNYCTERFYSGKFGWTNGWRSIEKLSKYISILHFQCSSLNSIMTLRTFLEVGFGSKYQKITNSWYFHRYQWLVCDQIENQVNLVQRGSITVSSK